MDLDGLLGRILDSVVNIDAGRKDLATDGFEHAGRLFYEDGIATALITFKEVQVSAEPKILILVELTFLQQEFQFCNEADAVHRRMAMR
jgi:hypothetical protein